MSYCQSNNFLYAGVQGRRDCWCSNSYGKYGRTSSESFCYLPCTGNYLQICGGSFTNSVYKTNYSLEFSNILNLNK